MFAARIAFKALVAGLALRMAVKRVALGNSDLANALGAPPSSLAYTDMARVDSALLFDRGTVVKVCAHQVGGITTPAPALSTGRE